MVSDTPRHTTAATAENFLSLALLLALPPQALSSMPCSSSAFRSRSKAPRVTKCRTERPSRFSRVMGWRVLIEAATGPDGGGPEAVAMIQDTAPPGCDQLAEGKLMVLRRVWAVVGVGAVAVACLVAPGETAAAVAPAPVVSDPQGVFAQMEGDLGVTGMKNQEALNTFRSWLNDQPGLYDAGFYDAAIDIPGRTMMLLWHGTSALQAKVIGEGAKRGLHVVIQAAPYTKGQVDAAMKKLVDMSVTTAQGTFQVTSVGGPVPGNDGLTVAGYFTARAARVTPQAAVESDAATLTSSIKSKTGLSAKVVYGEQSVPYTTRSTDSGDLNAGGMIRGADGSGCSSGFAINIGGVPHTTTARHCNATPYTAWDLASTSYGSTTTTSGIGLARVLSARGFYWMFDGAWNNAAGYHKTVNALADVSIGSHVCSSGANSGVHCTLVVDQMNESFNDGLGGSVTTIRVHQTTSGQIAGARGDSGGPILIPNSDGIHVWAVGMLEGSNEAQTTNCGSLRVPTQCSAYIEFTSERTIINSIAGASLRTG